MEDEDSLSDISRGEKRARRKLLHLSKDELVTELRAYQISLEKTRKTLSRVHTLLHQLNEGVRLAEQEES